MENEPNYRFSEKLIQLRREAGMSQEQLADSLSLSRQAVSKWESAQTLPSLDKIVQLADLFGVSVDYLIRDNAMKEEKNKTIVTTADDTLVMAQLNDIKSMMRQNNVYEFKSKTTFLNIPLVHIKFSNNGRPAVAKGIIAIGNIAVGIISLGAISVGILSVGAIAVGLLAAFGAIALGAFAGAGIAIGYFAFGGLAIGINAFGGVVLAKKIAAGGVACGKIAIGGVVQGEHTFEYSVGKGDALRTFLLEYCPDVPRWFIRLIINLL